MKKIILSSLFAGLVCFSAVAGGGHVIYSDEYTITTTTVATNYNAAPVIQTRPVAPARVVYARPRATARPCAHRSGNPVSVKTATEVIDHYQVYQPVTVYEPAGTYSTRRIIEAPRPCNSCN